MQSETIGSENLTLEGLFGSFYQVPVYQREYVWGEAHVQRLLEDVYEAFASSNGQSEYFIGSVVTQECADSSYDLIDGQQRVTTLYVTLCAIRDRLREIGATPPPDLEQQIASAYTDTLTAETAYKYRVTLQYTDGQQLLEALGRVTAEEDLHKIRRETQSSENILDAYELVRAYLTETFLEDVQQLKRYWLYMTRKVKVIRVTTGTLSDALRVFETINDRGIGLNAMDLLKNLLFINASPKHYEALRDKWELLARRLHGKEKPLRFLRYYLLADFAAMDLQANKVYEWMTKPANATVLDYQKDPVAFVERLLAASEAYTSFVDGKNATGSPSRHLVNLKTLAGSARQHLILLLAGRHLPAHAFDALAREAENLFFLFIVTRTPKNVFESRFAKWAPQIRGLASCEDLDAFVQENIQPLKDQMTDLFDLSLKQLGENSLPKYRRKYLLAKLAQHINDLAYPGAWRDLAILMDRSYEIEHILPLNPRPEVLAAFGHSEELENYKHRLGNLTLVEKPINASIANAGFEAKTVEYRKSNVLLTSSITEIETMGLNTSVNAALTRLRSYSQWDAAAIEAREKLMLRLAHEVWGLRVPLELVEQQVVVLPEVENA